MIRKYYVAKDDYLHLNMICQHGDGNFGNYLRDILHIEPKREAPPAKKEPTLNTITPEKEPVRFIPSFDDIFYDYYHTDIKNLVDDKNPVYVHKEIGPKQGEHIRVKQFLKRDEYLNEVTALMQLTSWGGTSNATSYVSHPYLGYIERDFGDQIHYFIVTKDPQNGVRITLSDFDNLNKTIGALDEKYGRDFIKKFFDEIVKQGIAKLKKMHEEHIAHNNIRPENILIEYTYETVGGELSLTILLKYINFERSTLCYGEGDIESESYKNDKLDLGYTLMDIYFEHGLEFELVRNNLKDFKQNGEIMALYGKGPEGLKRDDIDTYNENRKQLRKKITGEYLRKYCTRKSISSWLERKDGVTEFCDKTDKKTVMASIENILKELYGIQMK